MRRDQIANGYQRAGEQDGESGKEEEEEEEEEKEEEEENKKDNEEEKIGKEENEKKTRRKRRMNVITSIFHALCGWRIQLCPILEEGSDERLGVGVVVRPGSRQKRDEARKCPPTKNALVLATAFRIHLS